MKDAVMMAPSKPLMGLQNMVGMGIRRRMAILGVELCISGGNMKKPMPLDLVRAHGQNAIIIPSGEAWMVAPIFGW